MEVFDLYKNIFSSNFLIKYGYFDIKVNRIEKYNEYTQDSAFYSEIFSLEKLSKEIKNQNDYIYLMSQSQPKDNERAHVLFDDIDFTKFKLNINNGGLFDISDKKIQGVKPTEPIEFTIPKTSTSRRLYKMPNLYSYLNLVYYMDKNQDEFINEFLSNSFSTSKFFNQMGYSYDMTYEYRKKSLLGGKNLLKLDLSNFYHTLYTHSIPWVIKGKNHAKVKTVGDFANNIDKLITNCQFGETHGIPTGNMASRIIAEFYMCKIDKMLLEKGYRYSRYVDDILFSYNLESEKEAFYRDFNNICLEHNLIINSAKTKVTEFPYLELNNKSVIFSYLDSLNNRSHVVTWIREIRNLIDICINEEAKNNKGSITSLFSVIINSLKNKKLSKEKINLIFTNVGEISKYNLIENILDVSLKDSKLVIKFIEFNNELIDLGVKEKSIRIIINNYFKYNKDGFKKTVKYYHNHHYHQEFYQILLYLVEYKINDILNAKDLLELISDKTDDFSLVLLSILYIRRSKTRRKNGADISKFLSRIDDLFIKVHSSYNENYERMREKKWYFRFYIYTLIQENIIPKDTLDKYYKNISVARTKKNIAKNELEWEFIRNISASKITHFYEYLLDNKIYLVNTDKI